MCGLKSSIYIYFKTVEAVKKKCVEQCCQEVVNFCEVFQFSWFSL
jgi:hypothetical protein